MKPTLPFYISLALCGLAIGCSTQHQAASRPVKAAYVSEFPARTSVITSLGNTFTIAATADSWPDLIEKTKPTFTWNGRDLLWIQSDEHGQPRFILDEAYAYQASNQPCQWVLLNGLNAGSAVSDRETPQNFYSGQNLHAVMDLQNLVPQTNGSGARGNYAVPLEIAGLSGTVYELGWQRESSDGVAHPDYGRRIYVLRDTTNQWHFLGEGPQEGSEQGGPIALKSRVIWDSSSTNGPVAIRD